MRFLSRTLLVMALVFSALTSLCGASPLKVEDRVQLAKYNQFFSLLSGYYLEDIASKELVESAIKATLKELDPHSLYYTSDEMKGINEGLDGEFSGIGVEFSVMNDTLRVVNTIAGGPAEMVGVRANDKIIKIDTLSAIAISQGDVPKLLRGEAGTKVEIDVLRYGYDAPLHFVIRRGKIPIHTIDAAYLLNPTTGYIKVNRFSQTTMSEFEQAYKSLGRVDNLVLDLRGNGGGLLSAAVDMASFFLPKGSLIVSTQGRGVETQELRSKSRGEFLSGQVVVMIDGSSASASEIVAGAIQDWDRGVVVGRRSFGKGLVQRQIPFDDGSAVRLTIARYHTPSGRVIQRPYTNGESEEYYGNREVEIDSSKIYKTLRKGRDVYGGGGITPDIELVGDTTHLSPIYSKLIRQSVVNNYTILLLEREREELLNRYAKFEDFEREFEISTPMIEEVLTNAAELGIDVDNVDVEALKTESALYIKAILAQRLYATWAFYKIINGGNSEIFLPIEELLLKNGAKISK